MKSLAPFLIYLAAAGFGSTALGGCNAQVDPQYRGEPMATVKGSVVTPEAGPAAPSGGLDAAIVWMTTGQQGPARYTTKLVGSRVPVVGRFPAEFSLNVYAPPPADGQVLIAAGLRPDYLPTGVWLGVVVAVSTGAKASEIHPHDVVGADVGHLVLYFDHDLGAAPDPMGGAEGDSIEENPMNYAAILAQVFHVPGTKGYHLAKIDPGSPDSIAQSDQCRWGGLCVRTVGEPVPDEQEYRDWDYARCTQHSPSAMSCSEFWIGAMRSQADEAEDKRCTKLKDQRGTPTCSTPMSTLENAQGFNDPATIVLGKTIWDLIAQ